MIANIITAVKNLFGSNKPSVSQLFTNVVSSPGQVGSFMNSLPIMYDKEEIQEASSEMKENKQIHGNMIDEWAQGE